MFMEIQSSWAGTGMGWKLDELSVGQITTTGIPSIYMQPALIYVEESEAERRNPCWKVEE